MCVYVRTFTQSDFFIAARFTMTVLTGITSLVGTDTLTHTVTALGTIENWLHWKAKWKTECDVKRSVRTNG